MRYKQALFNLSIAIGILVLINILAHSRIGNITLYTRFDLTEDNRFTLTPATKTLLRNLDEVVYIKVLLQGDFPAGYKRLQESVEDMLLDFQSENTRISYQFEDPLAGNTEQVNTRKKQLAELGVLPVSLNVRENGERSQKLTYPYALFYYKGRSIPVNFLENQIPGVPPDVILNKAINLLEYKFVHAIQQLKQSTKPTLLFVEGHGESLPAETADLENSLRETYNTGRIILDSVISIDTSVKTVIISSPKSAFSDKDNFKIDQYVMRGGKLLVLADKIALHLDSLRRGTYMPNERDLNLDDLLFKYGARLLPNLLLDMQSSVIPLATGQVGNAPQFEYFRYPYHLVVIPNSNHPAVKNIGPVNMQFAGGIDTVGTKYPIKKTVLLHTSEESRYQFLPLRMNFDFMRYPLDEKLFNKGPQTVALLLEGSFSSLFENRVAPAMLSFLKTQGRPFVNKSPETKIMVISDADIIRNRIDKQTGKIIPAGYNEFEKYTFANKDLLLNILEYLSDSDGIIEARGKDIKLRLLNTTKIKEEKLKWQIINLFLPLVLITLGGLLFNFIRQRRYR
jgi:ABC-2 type transport system permease protein